MLKSLKLHGVGPVPELSATFGERLNIITGDNGLGKSFLLDVCFWALTGTWPGGRRANPTGNSETPTIEYTIETKSRSSSTKANYDFRRVSWNREGESPPTPLPVIYAAVDGSFAVWDPARNYGRDSTASQSVNEWPRAYQFPLSTPSFYQEDGPKPLRRDVANGLEEGGRVLCNGLIADWSEWYYQRRNEFTDYPFTHLERVVAALSHPSEPLVCDPPRRVFLDDTRIFPILRTPYGDVPYPQWSAGVKRIISLAYLMVWAWVEHIQAAELRREQPAEKMILLVDEIETHLHPKWQRTILPAILKAVDGLKKDLPVQILAATHSPLVLASLEPHFDDQKDQLFLFNVRPAELKEKDWFRSKSSQSVTFEALPWAAHGDVVGWLTSDIFGLEQARSTEAERAIEAAEAFMRGDISELPQGLSTKEEINDELLKLLPSLDRFWPRWIVRAKP